MEQVNLKELEQKANDGDAQSQFEWAMCCFDGAGVPQDESKAVEWLTKAVEQGHSEAQYALGICYDSGMGVAQDSAKAAELFAMSGG